jgi:hypothetical protein
MKMFVQAILLAPLVGLGIVFIREFEFTRDILELLKDIDYKKYEHLTYIKMHAFSFPYNVRWVRL